MNMKSLLSLILVCLWVVRLTLLPSSDKVEEVYACSFPAPLLYQYEWCWATAFYQNWILPYEYTWVCLTPTNTQTAVACLGTGSTYTTPTSDPVAIEAHIQSVLDANEYDGTVKVTNMAWSLEFLFTPTNPATWWSEFNNIVSIDFVSETWATNSISLESNFDCTEFCVEKVVRWWDLMPSDFTLSLTDSAVCDYQTTLPIVECTFGICDSCGSCSVWWPCQYRYVYGVTIDGMYYPFSQAVLIPADAQWSWNYGIDFNNEFIAALDTAQVAYHSVDWMTIVWSDTAIDSLNGCVTDLPATFVCSPECEADPNCLCEDALPVPTPPVPCDESEATDWLFTKESCEDAELLKNWSWTQSEPLCVMWEYAIQADEETIEWYTTRYDGDCDVDGRYVWTGDSQTCTITNTADECNFVRCKWASDDGCAFVETGDCCPTEVCDDIAALDDSFTVDCDGKGSVNILDNDVYSGNVTIEILSTTIEWSPSITPDGVFSITWGKRCSEWVLTYSIKDTAWNSSQWTVTHISNCKSCDLDCGLVLCGPTPEWCTKIDDWTCCGEIQCEIECLPFPCPRPQEWCTYGDAPIDENWCPAWCGTLTCDPVCDLEPTCIAPEWCKYGAHTLDVAWCIASCGDLKCADTCTDWFAKQSPGIKCDDNDTWTFDDQIQADGCTCTWDTIIAPPCGWGPVCAVQDWCTFVDPVYDEEKCLTSCGTLKCENDLCDESLENCSKWLQIDKTVDSLSSDYICKSEIWTEWDLFQACGELTYNIEYIFLTNGDMIEANQSFTTDKCAPLPYETLWEIINEYTWLKYEYITHQVWETSANYRGIEYKNYGLAVAFLETEWTNTDGDTGSSLINIENECKWSTVALNDQQVEFTITVQNTWEDMTSSEIVYDHLPLGFDFISSEPSFTHGSTDTWMLWRDVQLDAGEILEITLIWSMDEQYDEDTIFVNSITLWEARDGVSYTVNYVHHVVECTTDSDCDDWLYCNWIESCNTALWICKSWSLACPSPLSCNEQTDICESSNTNSSSNWWWGWWGARNNISYCGDGIQDESEQCDDGNRTNKDGCSSVCRLEEMQESAPVVEEETTPQEKEIVEKIEEIKEIVIPPSPPASLFPDILPDENPIISRTQTFPTPISSWPIAPSTLPRTWASIY